MSRPFAFVTLLSSDSYLPGALVVAAALKNLHPEPAQPPEVGFKTVCLVTPETVDVKSIKALRKAFDEVVGVEVLEAGQSEGLQLLGRPDLSAVLTKLHVFRLTEYAKIVFLDADILPVQPISHLFLTPHEFSACPDVGWPDIFNSGLMVLEPGEDKFRQLTQLMQTKGSWDGADQGLLNEWRGSNWNRLSFTYNTTPTAAYTYAPAYRRFGAAIKAIHFIGQNKPWKSIPWRAPIDNPSVDTMSSYGYSNLVDRWYAVYDQHYRPPIVSTEEEYRIRQYAPAWDSAAFSSSNEALSLEELKKLAVEGVSMTSASAPVEAGEGSYRSMPLEGRIHLMRPPKPAQESLDAPPVHHSSQDTEKTQVTPEQHHEPGDHGYRPPGREGLPSYLYDDTPYKQADQNPAADPVHTVDEPDRSFQHHSHQGQPSHHGGHDFHGHQSTHQHEQEYRPPSPPQINWNPAVEPPPHNPPPIVAMAFAEQYSNAWDLPPGRPIHHHHHQQSSYQDPWTTPSHYQHQPPHQHSSTGQHHHHHHHQQQQQQQHHHHAHQHHHTPPSHHQHHNQPEAHASAPYEASPHQRGHGHTEQDQYQPYSNAYHGQESRGYQNPHPPRVHRPEDFFQAPKMGQIPAHLIREGHYAAVTTSAPHPDTQKVEPIFPWEQRTRPAPRRVFPDWDPKPLNLQSPPLPPSIVEIEAALVAAANGQEVPSPRRRSPSPPAHVKRSFNPPPSPPERHGQIYVNAWDTDFGIQKYASRLQGRSVTHSPQPWPTHPGQEAHAKGKKPSGGDDDKEEYTNWAEKAEASSRDGDDEEDEDDIALLSPKSSARLRAAKAKGSYRHQGVQTDPKVTESRGVQVSIGYTTRPTFGGSSSKRDSYAGNDSTERPQPVMENANGNGSAKYHGLLPASGTDYFEAAYLPSASLRQAEEQLKAEGDIGSPTTPILRKRESSEDSITTAADSSVISSPSKEVESTTPKVQIRNPEPVESPPFGRRVSTGSTGSMRRGGRVFSPSTGVDIFKRGSEEVLARFLTQTPPAWAVLGIKAHRLHPPTTE